jgi:hypothetical protein
VVSVVSDCIVEVDVPMWAEYLQPQRWLGHHRDELLGLVGAILGGEGTVSVEPSEFDRVQEIAVRFGPDSAESAIHVLTVPIDGSTDQTERWYVSSQHASNPSEDI